MATTCSPAEAGAQPSTLCTTASDWAPAFAGEQVP